MAKRIICIVLLCFWMGVIFMFSAQPAKESSALSNPITDKVIQILNRMPSVLKLLHLTPDALNDTVVSIVRKTAHFVLYFVLGLLALSNALTFNLKKNPRLCALLFCFLYAASDEIHQLFVEGRSGQISDVGIDTAGAVVGILFLHFCVRCFSRKLQSKNIDC